MSIVTSSPMQVAYEKAVVAILNLCPKATEEQAIEAVNALTDLVFATLQAELDDKNDAARH